MDWEYYLQIVIKLVVTVLLLLVYVRISGKSQLAPMTAFDQIGNMVVGAIGGSTLLNTDVSILHSTVFMAMWIVILLFIRFLRSVNYKVANLIDGKRLQLVRDGEVLTENFKKAGITVSNMEILLHRDGLNGLYEAKNVWFETNGQLTIDKKGDENMSLILVEEGQINEDNLEILKKTEDWLEEQLEKHSQLKLDEVFCAEWVKDRLMVYPYQEE
ncbi:DUF421 domain-containing protein [Ruminococcaceae bacterium OttesenSCG-928-I18]|nr:DUF421 domain-containing protein [Ruminococcaceae bacterium OttesenSCG-928-I18]